MNYMTTERKQTRRKGDHVTRRKDITRKTRRDLSTVLSSISTMSAATPTETVHNPDHGTPDRSPLLESLADVQRNTNTSP
jgi:hypothetical protein